MFRSARIKLTVWYLLIIMVVSISFSMVIYRGFNMELSRIERIQRLRRLQFQRIDPVILEETRERFKLNLILINLGILGFSALAGFFLAGITLRPISEMLDKQNQFIADASHELRTPLSSLKTGIEVYLRSKSRSLKEADDLLKSNLEEVDNLQILSDNLIKLTGIKSFSGRDWNEEVSLKEVIVEAVKKTQKLAKHKNIKIIIGDFDSKIRGEKQNLIEVFVILLDNAIKYSDKNKTVKIVNENTNGFFEIKIIDQGFGIGKDDMPYLFDRFYRADQSRTKTKTPGFGLGLSIAREIVKNHCGEILIESELGKGSAATVRLPNRFS